MVPVVVGVSLVEPLIASVPDHAPDAVHDVAFVEPHVSVVGFPSVRVEGDAPRVTVGATERRILPDHTSLNEEYEPFVPPIIHSSLLNVRTDAPVPPPEVRLFVFALVQVAPSEEYQALPPEFMTHISLLATAKDSLELNGQVLGPTLPDGHEAFAVTSVHVPPSN